MAAYAAFLRGINVSGHRATKGQLVSAFEECGLGSVSTFRASGNVIFEAPARPRPDPKQMEDALLAELGFEVPVFLRSASQLAKVAASEPFSEKQLKRSKGKLQVAFLPRRPGKGKAREALDLQLDSDPLALVTTELYWLPASGTQQTALDLKALEKLLGPWTMRTMGTVQQLAAKLC